MADRRNVDFFNATGQTREEFYLVVERLHQRINYSERYRDDTYEFRHVRLPKEYEPLIPKDRLLSEHECRQLGIQQSPGWTHYMIHRPEPHVLCFRRALAAEQPSQPQEQR